MENQSRVSPAQWVALSIIIASLILSGTIIYTSSGFSFGSPKTPAANTKPTTTAAGTAVDVSKIKIAGNPFVGKDNAPVLVVMWEDFQCPFCKKVEANVTTQMYTEYVQTGKVKIVFKDYEFLGPDSQKIGKFARAVWEAVPGKYWDWRKAMFENQGNENTGWATQEKIMSITTAAIGAADAAKASQLATSKSAEYQKAIDADKAEGSALGINGTPATVVGKKLINGAQPYGTFKAAIEEALAAK